MIASVRRRRQVWAVWRAVGILAFACLILAPLGYMIIVSLTPDSQVGGGAIFPTHVAWGNYVRMWGTINLARDIGNSLLISASTGVMATLVAMGAAYVTARFRFPGRRFFLLSLATFQTIPGVMLLLPLFAIIVVLQTALRVTLIGTYFTVIMTYLTFALPFASWLLVSYLAAIPMELEEAALVDGAGRLQVVRHIVLPLAVPGMVVTFVFSFLLAWGDVLFASVLTNQSTRTLAVGLQAYVSAGETGGDVYWGQLMAASLASGLPIVVIFLLLQRYIIGGLTGGALKG